VNYTQGRLGRVFVARLEDGESIYDAVEEIARKEGIEAASVLAIGGIRRGKVVTGPQHPTGKVVPHYEEFDDARELVGVGMLFPHEGKPSLHFHAGIGRHDSALVGCPRAGMSVYLVLEVIITELVGAAAKREHDPGPRVSLLKVG
jgi:predicted DNA-binding protein with PD1-like motif